jgi:hypothetical protein
MASKWESTIRDLTWSFDDDMPRFRHEKWRKCFDDQLASSPPSLTSADPLFSLPLGEGSVKFETWLSRDDVWQRYRTLSQIAVLEGEKLEVRDNYIRMYHGAETRQEVKKAFFDAINEKDLLEDDQGRVAVHGQTFFAWTSRIPGQPRRSGG